jgi:hypothetical protein
MDNNFLSIQTDFIISYINNILNINILLVTAGFFLIYWVQGVIPPFLTEAKSRGLGH